MPIKTLTLDLESGLLRIIKSFDGKEKKTAVSLDFLFDFIKTSLPLGKYHPPYLLPPEIETFASNIARQICMYGTGKTEWRIPLRRADALSEYISDFFWVGSGDWRWEEEKEYDNIMGETSEM